MTEETFQTQKTPGIVIFVAILNFLSTTFFMLATLFMIGVLIFGNGMGLYEYVTDQITQVSPDLNVGFGLTFFFGVLLALTISFTVFHLIVGVGLLRGSKLFWFVQIALCVIGLLGFPLGTILNTVILVFFFQAPVRDFFKV